MNATDDGAEPLGESPAVPARYEAGIPAALAAIERGGVVGILSAADEVLATKQLAERQGPALNEIRERAREALRYPRSAAYLQSVLSEIRMIAEAGA